MRWQHQLRLRVRSLFAKRRTENDLDEELRFHLEKEAEQNLSRGVAPQEAHHEALMQFGRVIEVKQQCREARGMRMLDELTQDIRYGVRTLWRSPGFTVVAVLTLALGIGANTAIFSVVDAVMLKMLPVRAPDELFAAKIEPQRFNNSAFSYPLLQDMRQATADLADVFASGGRGNWDVVLLQSAGEGQREQVDGELISATYFTALGVNAIRGRVLTEDDARTRGGHAVAVISHRFWTNRLGNDPSAVGRAFRLNETVFTIVGIAPREFFGTSPGSAPDVWVPMVMQSQVYAGRDTLNEYGHTWMSLMGRRRPGVSREQVAAAMNVTFHRGLEERASHIEDEQIRKRELAQDITLVEGRGGLDNLRRRFSQPLLILMAVVGMVLLIACVNVANLLLARGSARRRETAVRLALGAARGRLLRQLLTESLLLAGMGGLLGLAFAYAGSNLLVSLVSSVQRSLVLDVSPDLGVLGFTAAVVLLAALLFGLAPALAGSRADLRRSLGGAFGRIQNPGGMRVRKALTVAQVALSLMLLVVAGLFLRTLHNLTTFDLGFNRDHVLMIAISPRNSGYGIPSGQADEEQRRAAVSRLDGFYRRLIETIQTVGGVESATISTCGVLSGCSQGQCCLQVEGYTPRQDEFRRISTADVWPGYFATMQIPLLAGRVFNERDTAAAPRVAILNETAARYYFGNNSAVGKTLRFDQAGQTIEIVGVVKDVKQNSVREETERLLYYAMPQNMFGMAVFAIRTRTPPERLAPEVLSAMETVDARLRPLQMMTADEALNGVVFQEQLVAQLSTFFGFLAVALTCVGLYGLVAYSVIRRTSEIGLRSALGAQRGDILWLILREDLRLAGLGVGLGLLGALATTHLTGSLLFELTPTDPLTIAGAALVMVVVSLAAGYLPARRAARIPPMAALRYE